MDKNILALAKEHFNELKFKQCNMIEDIYYEMCGKCLGCEPDCDRIEIAKLCSGSFDGKSFDVSAIAFDGKIFAILDEVFGFYDSDYNYKLYFVDQYVTMTAFEYIYSCTKPEFYYDQKPDQFFDISEQSETFQKVKFAWE